MQSPVSAIAFELGNFEIRYYSIMMFFAMLSATIFMYFIAKKYYKNTDAETVLDMLPFVILCAILGARLYYVIFDWEYFAKHLTETIAIWHGGISIHGAILGGLLAGIVYTKIRKLNFLAYADVFSYGLILGQAIGRWGNYFNIEAFGLPCNLPWRLAVPVIKRPLQFINYEYFHPTFLYESLWNIFVLVILFFVVRKLSKNISGIVFCSYLVLYSIGRLFIESIRIDSIFNIGGLQIAQIMSILLILVGMLGIFILIFGSKKQW